MWARARALLDALAWAVARGAVDAVRFQPRYLDLVMACGARQPEVSPSLAQWLADTRVRPAVVKMAAFPHAVLRAVAPRLATWFGPTASAGVRWFSGATAALADRAGAIAIERPLRARVHPGLLVPHLHTVAVLAADMRGFSALTQALHDTQYLTDLIEEYLTELTDTVERHRGVVFQYTGDGLLAIFLPELAGVRDAAMLERLTYVTTPELHAVFDTLHERWRSDWRATGRPAMQVGLGVGLSFGQASIGFLGPSGKKQFGVIGEPANLAAFLCSEARAGAVLIDHASFGRAGAAPPSAKVARLRSKKLHRRIEAVCLHYGARRRAEPPPWLPATR